MDYKEFNALKALETNNFDSIYEHLLYQIGQTLDILNFARNEGSLVKKCQEALKTYYKGLENVPKKHRDLIRLYQALQIIIKELEEPLDLWAGAYKINITIDFLRQQFRNTKDLLNFIMQGYFSHQKKERFSRVVTYIELIVKYYEEILDYEEITDFIENMTEKGDYAFISRNETIRYVKDLMKEWNIEIKISPSVIKVVGGFDLPFGINLEKMQRADENNEHSRFREKYYDQELSELIGPYFYRW